MILATDSDLYIRGATTLLASWEEYARGSSGAALRRLNGVSAAVFPNGPERGVYNNALLERDLGPTERAAAVDAMEAAYRAARVDRYAAWVHESDEGMRAFHVVAARVGGETVATGLAFDHDGDCGVFNVSTLEAARRRGLGTALTARHVHDAVERGCSTASLQSTPMAERVYAAVGFRDLGRILEYAPAALVGDLLID